MIRDLPSSVRVRLAASLVVSSIALLCWTTQEAVRPPRLSKRVVLSLPTLPTPIGSNDDSSEAIIEAFERDPFSTTRQHPVIQRMSSSATAPAPIAAEVLNLVGTVVDSDGGSFVLCQLGSNSTRVLRVGDVLGPYELHSIAQGSATFVTGDGRRLELRVPKTGS